MAHQPIAIKKLFRGDAGAGRFVPASEYKDEEHLTVIMGLDFGTCSTKAAYRIMPDNQITAIRWDHGVSGYSNYTLPSTVSYCGGRLYFADEAERVSEEKGASTLRSIKRCLLCCMGEAGDCHRMAKPCSEKGEDKVFRFPLQGSAYFDASASELISLYIAFIMRRAKQHFMDSVRTRPVEEGLFQRLKRWVGLTSGEKKRGPGVQFIWNAAAPVDLMSEYGKEVYEKALHTGERLVPYVENGVRARNLIGRSREFLKTIELPPYRQRSVWCFAEHDASLSSFVQARGRETGLFCIMDIGAGTTSLAFFHIPDSFQTNPAYLACRTFDWGCDDLDEMLAVYWFTVNWTNALPF